LTLPAVRFQNFSPRAIKYARADALFVSIPKSGRTWLRFFLRHYLCTQAGVPFSIEVHGAEPGVPRVVFAHDLWEHLSAPRAWERALGCYLIPKRARERKQIVLLVRDLRDVMVSLHLQLTRRGFRSGLRFGGDLAALVRDPVLGAERTVEILNAWLAEWRGSERFHLWVYEECRKDPERVFGELLAFLGLGPVDPERLQDSIEFASFENMQRMERDERFEGRVLRPGNVSDRESFKVRRGVVGGYRDYLGGDEIAAIERAASRLEL
jgi:hypothetical protein